MGTVKYPIVTCNECGYGFKLKTKIVKKEKVGEEGVERSFFVCPKCKHKYTILYEDQEFKNNIGKMNELKNQMSKTDIASDEAKEILKSYENLHQRNIDISKEYRKVYGD